MPTTEPAPTLRPYLVRALLIAAGTLLLALGVIGLFLPVLPTTPFLLLAAACYLRSSPRLYRRLLDSRLLGTYLRSYYAGRRLPLAVLVPTLILLWLTLGGSGWWAWRTGRGWLSGLLLLIGVGVTVHLTRLRSRGPGRAEGRTPGRRDRER